MSYGLQCSNGIISNAGDLFSSPFSWQLFSWLAFSWPLSWLAFSSLLFSWQLSLPPSWALSSSREISSSVVSVRRHRRGALEEQAQALPLPAQVQFQTRALLRPL